MRFVSIGHVSRDVVAGSWRPGGSAFYGAAAAARLGCDTTIVSPIGAAERATVENVSRDLGIRLVVLPSPVTTSFVGSRAGAGGMRWRVAARAPEIGAADVVRALTAANLPERGDAVLVASIDGEIAADVPPLFRGATRVAAAQGFLREIAADGTVRPRRWLDAERYLKELDAVVVSEEDLGEHADDAERWSRRASVIVTRAAAGARLWRDGERVDVPGFPREAADPIGAGDTFAAALAIGLAEGRSPEDAVRFANAVASFAVEGEWIRTLADRSAVERRLAGGR